MSTERFQSVSHRAIDMIISEHRQVENMFNEYQRSTDLNRKQALAFDITKALCMHSNKEQMTLYPMIRDKIPNKNGKVDHSLQEHAEVEQILYELDNMKVQDAGFDSKMQTLISNVLHHAQEEETDLLKMLPNYLSAAELETLATEWEAAATTAVTRPHPAAPKEGLLHKAAQAMTKPIDVARDAARNMANPDVAKERRM